jgi:hypothetical protein
MSVLSAPVSENESGLPWLNPAITWASELVGVIGTEFGDESDVPVVVVSMGALVFAPERYRTTTSALLPEVFTTTSPDPDGLLKYQIEVVFKKPLDGSFASAASVSVVPPKDTFDTSWPDPSVLTMTTSTRSDSVPTV